MQLDNWGILAITVILSFIYYYCFGLLTIFQSLFSGLVGIIVNSLGVALSISIVLLALRGVIWIVDLFWIDEKANFEEAKQTMENFLKQNVNEKVDGKEEEGRGSSPLIKEVPVFNVVIPAQNVSKKMRLPLSTTAEDIKLKILPTSMTQSDIEWHEVYLPSIEFEHCMRPRCSLYCYWGKLKQDDTIIVKRAFVDRPVIEKRQKRPSILAENIIRNSKKQKKAAETQIKGNQ